MNRPENMTCANVCQHVPRHTVPNMCHAAPPIRGGTMAHDVWRTAKSREENFAPPLLTLPGVRYVFVPRYSGKGAAKSRCNAVCSMQLAWRFGFSSRCVTVQ